MAKRVFFFLSVSFRCNHALHMPFLIEGKVGEKMKGYQIPMPQGEESRIWLLIWDIHGTFLKLCFLERVENYS